MLKISITLPNNAQINLETADAAVIDKILDAALPVITRNLTGAMAAVDGGPAAPVPAEQKPPSAAAPTEQKPPAAAAPTEQKPPAAVPQPPPAPSPAPVQNWETAAPEVLERETIPSPWPAAAAAAVPVPAAFAKAPETDLDPEEEDWPAFDDGDDDEDDDAAIESEKAALSRLAVNGAAAARPGMFGPSGSEQAFIDFCREASPLGDMRRVVVAAEAASRYLGMSGVDALGLGHLFNLAGWPQAHSFTQTLRNAARSKFRWLERVPGRAGYYAVTDLGRKTALGE